MAEARALTPSLGELRRRRAEILALATKRGASNVRVFGSVARGEADEKSDVDLLVDFRSGTGLFTWSSLEIDLEALLGRPVHVATVAGLKDRIRSRVLAEAVEL